VNAPPRALITFDTELFWGLFFLPEFAGRDAEMARVRPALERILALLDARRLPATFALAGRLFLEPGEVGDGPLHPDLPDGWAARAAAGTLEHRDAWFGRDLVERIRESTPGLRALFMSGYTADVISKRGVLEDGVCFIQKPFTIDGIAAKVREALGQARCL